MKFTMKHFVRTNGTIDVTCIFHNEKTPSLRIWGNGRFRCHGCQEEGVISEHPELQQLFNQVQFRRLEEAGQLRLPGVLV